MAQHRPVNALAGTLKAANAPATKKGSAYVPVQTCIRGYIKEDDARGTLESLRHARRIIAIDHPAITTDRLVVQGVKRLARTWLPLRMRQMVQLIQMNYRKTLVPGDRIRERRFAAIRRPKNADART
ncbi:MAG: hypothetical protein WBW32_12170 [Luteibacter sp.]